ITSRTASESSFSAIAVEPLRSEKTIVTVFRTSCGGSAGASAVPQNPHRRNFCGFSSPQFGQTIIRRTQLGADSADREPEHLERGATGVRHFAHSASVTPSSFEHNWM